MGIRVGLGGSASGGGAQTGAQIRALLNALPRGSRLSYTWLDSLPTSAPGDTTVLFGDYAARTEIPANMVVLDGGYIYWTTALIPATNTTPPATNSSFKRLDFGGTADIVNLQQSGSTITVTRRDGTQFEIMVGTSDGSGAATISALSGDNFPVDDPPDQTLFFFIAPQDSFTSGKTVRNDADDGDVTSANERDLFKFFENGSKWVRQYQSASTPTADQIREALGVTEAEFDRIFIRVVY